MENYQELNIEKDFWDDFIVEAFEHIEEIESNAMSLEQNPNDMEIIHTMFRAFHTIKGLSGFVEHSIIQEVAHKTETMMDLCRKGDLSVNTQIVDAILKSSDYIKQLCENVEAYKDASLIAKIQTLNETLEKLSNPEQETSAVEVEPQGESQALPEPVYDEENKPEEIKQDDFFEQVAEVKNEEIIEQAVEQQEVQMPEIQAQQPQNEPEQNQQEEVEIQSVENSESVIGLEFFAQEINEIEAEQNQENSEPEGILLSEEITDNVSEPVVEPENVQSGVQTEIEESISEKIEPQTIINFETLATKTEKQEEIKEEKVEVYPEMRAFQGEIFKKLSGKFEPQTTKSEQSLTTAKTSSVNEEYMKVANYKIDHLVDMIGELIINQSLIEQYVFSKYNDDRQLVSNLSGFLRTTRDLQNLSMSLRMVSLKPTYQKVTRIARDTIQELHKNVEFVTSGEGTEIDRVVAEKLLDPLVHLIKNAISHGVEEKSEDRTAIGKEPKARVELNAYSKRGKIFIEIKDDGRGINTEVVYKKALEKGLIDENRTYSDSEIKEFIMLPGFSTAKVVDNISGRGVGMDVVQTQISKIGGKVEIQSELNIGSKFILEVPVNHAIMNGTIIEMNQQQFVVPTVNVKEFLQPEESQWIFTKEQRTMIKVRDNIIPIVPPSVFFKDAKDEEYVPLVMIVELDQELRAVPITNVLNRQEVVVKPVGEEFSHLKYISGMSILGTGRVSLILDIDYLFRKEIKE